MTHLYHADLIGSAFSIVGQWFIYKKKWWGWLLGATGSVCFIYVNFLFGAYGMEPITVLMLVTSLYSAFKWSRPSVAEVDLMSIGTPVSADRLAYIAETVRQSKIADGTLPRNTPTT